MKRPSAVLALLLAEACAKSGTVVQLSSDTYVVSHTNKGGAFGSASAMKVDGKLLGD